MQNVYVPFSIIAERLKQTDKGVAEVFDEASVYYSDIVGFTKLAADSTPMEVINLLSDLYTALDSVIAKHDVYKVFIPKLGTCYCCCNYYHAYARYCTTLC